MSPREAEIRARLDQLRTCGGGEVYEARRTLEAFAPDDIAYLLDRVAELEAEKARVVAELRGQSVKLLEVQPRDGTHRLILGAGAGALDAAADLLEGT